MKIFTVRILLFLLVLISVILFGCASGGTPTPSPSPTTTTTSPSVSPAASPTSGGSVTIDLVAQNLAFDKNSITVPAGAQVTINFNNKDNGIPHNFAVYDNQNANQTIFKGEVISGPATTTYKFTAPSMPGNYFFRCDVHPTTMTGTFTVQ